MQIKHLKYKQIDFKKYDDCIQKAYNSRIYAFSWYLDIVAKKDWEILVLGDYEAVMPIPFYRVKKKFLKRLVTQPLFCQQLGVFSLTELKEDTHSLFIQNLEPLDIHNYSFNTENTSFLKEKKIALKKINLELDLQKTAVDLEKNYSKNLKRNIKKGINNQLKITKKIVVEDFMLMKKSNATHKIKKKQLNKIKTLITEIQKREYGAFYGVKKENTLVAIVFILKFKNRLIHLFSVSNSVGKKMGAIPFLFDSIIKKNANTNTIFDFEGSMIASIAKFFKSFGAVENIYLEINNV